jgi:hypothetical protein
VAVVLVRVRVAVMQEIGRPVQCGRIPAAREAPRLITEDTPKSQGSRCQSAPEECLSRSRE